MTPFRWSIRVRFVDTDASGRIHYTAMFRYFEAAEFELLRSLGISYQEFADCSFPRVHVDCDYKGPTKVDDLLTVAVTVAARGRSSFSYEFAASGEDGSEVARGKITVVCVSRETRKSHPLPQALLTAFERAS
jgi:acyl-CoA thioester hydrolase